MGGRRGAPTRGVGALYQPAGRSGQRRRLSVRSQEHEGDDAHAGARVGDAGPAPGSAAPHRGGQEGGLPNHGGDWRPRDTEAGAWQ